MVYPVTRHFLIAALVLALTQVVSAASADEVRAGDVKTFGTAGKELKVLDGGREAELFSRAGAGCLTHMWFGGDWKGYLRTRVRVYVDGEKTASIDMELGLGVGIGFEDTAAPWGIARMGKTGNHSGVYNTFRIPFGGAIRVTAQLPDDVKENPDFWWIIRGSTNLPVTIAGVKLPDSARLHLYKRENYTAQPLEEFDLCNTTHPGALYLVTIAGRSQGNLNFLEAQMRAYLNGAKEPLMLSSGLEDYFLGTYYFQRGKYYTPVAGLTHLDQKDNSFSAYRFHDDDPIFCKSGLRLTCRCGEKAGDKQYGDPKPTTYSTYAWVYEW
jgi:hypothetical protein